MSNQNSTPTSITLPTIFWSLVLAAAAYVMTGCSGPIGTVGPEYAFIHANEKARLENQRVELEMTYHARK